MPDPAEQRYNLAIETSGRTGAVVLGVCGPNGAAEIIAAAEIDPPPRAVHKRVNLVPAIADLCRQHDVAPAAIGEVYVSIGPGSFTGLRNAVTTAKMLALVHGTKIVAVPTCDAVVHAAGQAPATSPGMPAGLDTDHAAVGLNTKRGQVYAVVYRRDSAAELGWRPVLGPGQMTVAELLEQAPRPLVILGDALPAFDWPPNVTLAAMPPAAALGRSVWTLGRARAARGQFTDPLKLLPLYARKPEAVALWDKRKPNAP